MKDAKGMTALHIAAHQVNSSSYWAKYAVQVILDTPSLSILWNEKDAKGNTPLHHHSKTLKYIKALMFNSRVDKMAFNEENLGPFDIALTSEELSDKKELRKAKWEARKARFVSMMKEASQVHLLVDTIIATVAFTAGVTMPGVS
nr:hypothetical protein CFP56_42032 [Quercus suber]